MAPVIGIILLLAITVLLVGTAGAFFFGFTQQPAEAEQPRVAFDFEADVGGGSDTLEIKHTSGKKVLAENLYVELEDAQCSASGSPDGRYNLAEDFDFPAEKMGAGMTAQVGTELGPGGTVICSGTGNDLNLSGATVTLIWENGNGASSPYRSWSAN